MSATASLASAAQCTRSSLRSGYRGRRPAFAVQYPDLCGLICVAYVVSYQPANPIFSNMTSRHPQVHERRDLEKLRLHRVIAEYLRDDPEGVLSVARENLRRWQELAGPTPYYEEWERLLSNLGTEELVDLITSESEEATRLRQSTPFAGVVPPSVRAAVIAGL
jgi:hypothetical protein